MPKDINIIIGMKLKEVREKLGLTLEQVASSMGFKSYQTLSSIEDGSRIIKAAELSKLSKIYFRDINYFLSNKVEEEKEVSIAWRAFENEKESKLKEQEFLKYCRNYFFLETKLGIDNKVKINFANGTADDYNFNSIDELAKTTYRAMQLGSRPACSLAKVLEEKHNIKIFFLDLQGCGSAACAMGEFGAAILINSNEPPWRINYNLAHELFHLLTWDIFKHEDCHVVGENKPLAEKFADAFASALLLPAEELETEVRKRMDNNQISFVDLIGLAREFEVSIDALLWRLVNIKIFDRNVVKELLQNSQLKTLDSLERSRDWTSPQGLSDRYFNLALKAFNKEFISKGKLCELLNVDRADLTNRLQEAGYLKTGEEIYAKKFSLIT